MFKTINYFAFTVMLFFTTEVFSQKYTEGWFEFGLISLEVSEEANLDSSMVESIRNNMESELDMTIYFSENRVAIKKSGLMGGVSHAVYDLKEKKFYEFKEVLGKRSFTVDNSDLPEFSEEELAAFPSINKESSVSLKKFDLECNKYELEAATGKAFIITTKDIVFADVLKLNQIPEDLGTVVQTIIDEPSSGMKLVMGMKSFSPNIEDREVSSIDTIGMENVTLLRDASVVMFEKMAEEEQQNLEEYGEYNSSSTNIELIQKLVDLKAFNAEDYNISGAIESNDSYDIPSILLLAINSDQGLPKMARDSIKQIFLELDILTENVEKVLELEDDVWNEMHEVYRYESICLASIKDHLNSMKTKEMIVKNLKLQKLGEFDENNIAKDYINGLESIEHLLNETNVLTKLNKKIVTSNKEIYDEILYFFNIVFLDSDINLDISRQGNIVSLIQDELSYEIMMDQLKPKTYERNSENEYIAIYNDTTEINEEFYEYLLKIVKQIGADNSSPFSYNIFNLQPPLTTKIHENNYNGIIEILPFLNINIDALYFHKFAKEENDVFKYIGTSYPYHPDDISWSQIKLGNLFIGDNAEYVTSKEKIEFIDFIKRNKDDLGLEDEFVENLFFEININRLYNSESSFLSRIPNFIIEGSSYKFAKAEVFKTSVNEKYNLKDVYPSIASFFGQDFQPTNFTYDEKMSQIGFTYLGKKYSVNNDEKSMLNFIYQNMKVNKSGKRLYLKSQGFRKVKYFYVKPSLKEELSEIIDLKF